MYAQLVVFDKFTSRYFKFSKIHVPYMCSILTKGSTCRKNIKLRFLLILVEQVMTKLLKKKLAL